MKQLKILFIFFILFMFLIGCSKESKKDIVFTIDNQEVTIGIGETYIPNLTIENIENYELEYKYYSDSITIEDGVIYTKSSDYCEIIISIKNHPEVNPITLYLDIVEIEPTKIITEEEATIIINDSYQLNVSFEPSNSTKLVTYSVNNKNIASVDENGLIKGISEGETYVLVTSQINKSIRSRVKINVIKPPVDKIETISSLSLTYNETYQINYKVLPQEANQEVIFESLDPSIASVDDKGVITAFKYGTTTINIIPSLEKDKYVSIEVKVDGEKATDLIIEEENINLQLGEEYLLKYSIIPNNAYQGFDITISDNDGIEFNDNKILAKKKGTYTIELKTIDGSNISKTIIINVIGEESIVFKTNNIFEKQSLLSWNETFNPLDNIRAFSNIDGEITNQIQVKGTVDNKRYGEYILEYSVSDSKNNTKTLTRIINVIWGYDVTVIGHAGSYYGVPNSEEAILYAAEVLKYPAIEIDLKQTKDGVFVLSHDPVWGNVELEKTNYEDLKNVEYTVTKSEGIPGKGLSVKERTYTSKICTFERYLEICKEYNIIAIIELKTSSGISNWTESNAPDKSRMPAVMELIKKHEMLDRVVFLTSQELCLNWVKTHGYDYIPCQYLTLSSCENENTYNIVKKYKLDISFNVRDGIKISDTWLNKYRQLGCKLAVFTFEEYASYEEIQLWIDRGVDYVTTDWHELDKLKLS